MSREARGAPIPVDFDPFRGGAVLDFAPATAAQREVWLAAQMGDDANCAFNESVWIRLKGALDVNALRATLRRLVLRHDALRAVFSRDGRTFCILDVVDEPIRFIDLMGVAEAARAEHFDAVRRRAVERPFDLVEGPLFRADVVRMSDTEHCLIITVHHIVCDGWSWNTLLEDFIALWKCAGDGSSLPRAASFAAHARQQVAGEASPEVAAALGHWTRQLEGDPPVMSLPTDHARAPQRTYRTIREDAPIDATVVGGLRKLGAKSGCTLFTTLFAGFAVYLQRIAQQADLTIAITAAGQVSGGEARLVGHSVHVLPLRVQLDPDAGFVAQLPAVNRVMLDAFEHRAVTLGQIVEHVPVRRDASRLAVTPVRFNLGREIEDRVVDVGGVDLELFTNARTFEVFELFVDARETRGGLTVECYGNPDLFEASTLRRWLNGFEVLLRAIVQQPEQAIARLPLVLEAEQAPLDGARVPAGLATRLGVPEAAHPRVLDAAGEPLPPGIIGEVYVTEGESSKPTGFRGWLSTRGELHLAGEITDRVVRRGFHFGLEEVDAVLGEHPGVRAAAAVSTGRDGDGAFAAYLVADADTADVDLAALDALLHRRLPAFMCPIVFGFVDALPCLADGSVDRQALASMPVVEVQRGPPDAIARALLPIWRRLLELDDVGVRDPWFALGGTSLRAAALAGEIERQFGVEMSLATVVASGTIDRLAQAIRDLKKVTPT